MRLFEGSVRQEIRVRSRRPAGRSNTQILGCEFQSVSAKTLDVVRNLLLRLDPARAGVS
jgi:hypothetical protein